VRERCELDVGFVKGYLYLRPLGSHNWTIDPYMIDLVIMLSLLPLVFEG
jgi:hypothetical protein